MRWFEKVKGVNVDVLVLPGFNEGYSQRGAWFAWLPGWKMLLKKFSFKMQHFVRWNIYEPTTDNHLSDGEIDFLLQRINKENDGFLERLRLTAIVYDGQTGALRKAGWLSFLLYVFGIITVQAWWLIYLTMPQFIFFNLRGERQYKKGKAARNVLGQIWRRGKDEGLSQALKETLVYYNNLTDLAPLDKYRRVVDWAQAKARLNPNEANHWRQIVQAYSDIVQKLTGKSYLLKALSPSPGEMILRTLFMAPKTPEPENVFPVRNLDKKISMVSDSSSQNSRVENSLNIFLLSSRSGKLICVPDAEPSSYIIDSFSRSMRIAEDYSPLRVNLYVGTEKEKELFVGPKQTELQQKVQNAALDTLKGDEAVQAWVSREVVPRQAIDMLLGRWTGARGADPATKIIMAAFPWMFLAGGQPAYSLLAISWIFVYPLLLDEGRSGINEYFTTVLDGVKAGYHNMVADVKVHDALGHINNKIIHAPKEARIYREIQRDINSLALPASLMNQAIFNNVVMETPQLTEAQREACNFTFIPMEILDESGRPVKAKVV